MRLIILGNSGSGKSTLARRLVAARGVVAPILSLDDIAWNEGTERKPLEESRQLLLQFIQTHPDWIVEGCYGDLVETALPYCTELHFLNPGVEACISHCRNRPWEPEKFARPEDQQAMLAPLLEWVRAYPSRSDEFGLMHHQALFEAFSGRKHEYTDALDYVGSPP